MKLEKDNRMTEIFAKFQGLLMYAISKEINFYEDARDICQDVFIAFYVAFHEDEVDDMPDARAKAMLMRIMKNKVIDYIRKRVKVPMIYLDDYEEDLYYTDNMTYCIEDLVIHREQLREISKALLEVGDDWRDPVLLHAVAGMSHDEISELLGIPPSVLRTRLCRCRKWLRETYKE